MFVLLKYLCLYESVIIINNVMRRMHSCCFVTIFLLNIYSAPVIPVAVSGAVPFLSSSPNINSSTCVISSTSVPTSCAHMIISPCKSNLIQPSDNLIPLNTTAVFMDAVSESDIFVPPSQEWCVANTVHLSKCIQIIGYSWIFIQDCIYHRTH